MRLHPLRQMLCLVLLATSGHAMANESRQATTDEACPDTAAASSSERTDDAQADDMVVPARQTQKAKPAMSASPRATGGTRTSPPRFHSFLPGMFR
ncbi:MAG TPA: hypothetical protein VLC71_03095 [Thermomonas sp.]|nr:hypothetical protein [Thermomonas sp.]